MIPQQAHQIIPGAANDTRESFTWSIFMGSEILAYASGKYVVIYQGNTLTQVLHGHQDKVTCVEWCRAYGKLVACSKGRIVLYSPEKDTILDDEEQMSYVEECQGKISARWKVDQTIEMNDPNINFTCACWNLFGDRLLISGGDYLFLYELNMSVTSTTANLLLTSPSVASPISSMSVSNSKSDFSSYSPMTPTSPMSGASFTPATPSSPSNVAHFNSGGNWDLVWQYANPTPALYVEFSPDERFFVSISENDRLVKVWYRVRPIFENSPDDFAYIYLPHPRGVVSVCWRQKEVQQKYVVSIFFFL